MPLPRPEPGLVIRYNYLWRQEADRAQQHSKDRPAAILASVTKAKDVEVVILPITHIEPEAGMPAVEIPRMVKSQLGLDEDQSWVILAECNVDSWPTPDLAQIPGRPGQYAYGYLPPRLFRIIRDAFVAHATVARTRVVRRGRI